MKKKSEITVREAVEQVFNELPKSFHAPIFCQRVKVRTGRMNLMDGTILRRLREARADSLEYHYRCIDNTIALYEKSKLQPVNQ